MPIFRTSPGDRSLGGLQQAIQDQEVVLGYLVNLAPTSGGNNRIAYVGVETEADIPPEGKGSFLLVIAGHPPAKAGAQLVCSGPIFIDGTLQDVAAYRPDH